MAVLSSSADGPHAEGMPAKSGADAAHPVLDVRYETFVIARELAASPAEVFAAFGDHETRRRWFRLPGTGATYRHEFSIGGGEEARSTFALIDADSQRLAYRSHYLDIVADRRIVFAYESSVDEVPRWASLVTVLIADSEEGGTVLTWTEQVAFLSRTGDGSADFPHLRGGTMLRLNGLAAALDPQSN